MTARRRLRHRGFGTIRLNDVMKQLTIIATVFLPLSFLTGFFGQNFAWLVSRIGSTAAFWGIGVGTDLVAVAGPADPVPPARLDGHGELKA